MDKQNQKIRNAVGYVYLAIRDEATPEELNDKILKLNKEITALTIQADQSVISDVDLLRQAVLDYESKFENDIELEEITSFK